MSKDTKKLQNAAALFSNPLRFLTQSQIERLLEMYRRGQDVKLQLMFKEIESVMPLFGICINKRQAGILDRKWKILPLDDSTQAKEQATEVQKVFNISNTYSHGSLDNALAHLELASFRGRSCVKPYFNDKGDLNFKKVENWYTLQCGDTLYWNPEMNQNIQFTDDSYTKLQVLSDSEVCWISNERPIDIPGFSIYLRQLVGESKWAECVERQGIPQVLLTAPEGTSDANLDAFNARAAQIWLGGSGTLPNGTGVNLLTEGRGQDPFSEFCQHQMKMICLLAIGSTAAVLGDVSGGLNEGISNLQKSQFDSFVTQDCKAIANSMTRCVVSKVVRHLGYKENLCKFQFVEDETITTNDYLEMLTKLKSANIPVNIEEFKKVTGISFIDETKDIWQPEA